MISADQRRCLLEIFISSMAMILAYYRQRPRNICTDHCIAKEFRPKRFSRIFQVRFAKGRVFKVHFAKGCKEFSKCVLRCGRVLFGASSPNTHLSSRKPSFDGPPPIPRLTGPERPWHPKISLGSRNKPGRCSPLSPPTIRT